MQDWKNREEKSFPGRKVLGEKVGGEGWREGSALESMFVELLQQAEQTVDQIVKKNISPLLQLDQSMGCNFI